MYLFICDTESNEQGMFYHNRIEYLAGVFRVNVDLMKIYIWNTMVLESEHVKFERYMPD